MASTRSACRFPIAGLNAKNGTIGVWSSVDRRKVTTRGAATRELGRLDPGQPPREPAGQRGRHPDGPQGPVERAPAVAGRAFPEVLHDAHPRCGHQQAVQARRAGDRIVTTSSRCCSPASRSSTSRAPTARGPAPRLNLTIPVTAKPEPHGRPRGRQPGLAERPPARRRRHRHRRAGSRRLPQGNEAPARRRRQRRRPEAPRVVPVRRGSAERASTTRRASKPLDAKCGPGSPGPPGT